jgi:hypothetical protein
MYSRALDDATDLPLLFVKVRCRPSYWRVLAPFSTLPRLTLGANTLIVRHIDRNIAKIIRYYSVREALGNLTEEGARDRASCMVFRNSLPPARLSLLILGMTVPATIIALLLSPLVQRVFVRAFSKEGFDRAFQEIAKEALNLVTGGGGGGLLTAVSEAMRLGVQGVLALLSIILITSYLVSRPLVSAFRIKRQILCLADQDALGIKETASSWYVNKSTGAYVQERKVAKALGLRRAPIERPLDLVILAFPALCALLLTAWFAWETGKVLVETQLSSRAEVDVSWFFTLYSTPLLLLWLFSLGFFRFKWLQSAWRGRQGTGLAPPQVYRTSNGDYVEARPVTEAAAWPLVSGPVFFTLLVYPLLGVIQFHRIALTGDRLRAEAARREGRSRRRGHPVLTTVAFASIIATPIVVCAHLWRLCTLLGRHHVARKYKALAILAFLLLFPVIPITHVPLVEQILLENDWAFAILFVDVSFATLLYPMVIAAIQRCQNHLVQAFGTPVPYGRCENTSSRSLALISDKGPGARPSG